MVTDYHSKDVGSTPTTSTKHGPMALGYPNMVDTPGLRFVRALCSDLREGARLITVRGGLDTRRCNRCDVIFLGV